MRVCAKLVVRLLPLLPLLAGRAGAEQVPFNSLLNNSPFGQTRSGGPTTDASNAPVEFRGVVVEGAEKIFSVYEPEYRRSFWLKENETEGRITVRHFDEAASTLSVEYGSDVLQLSIRRGPKLMNGSALGPFAGGPAASAGQPSAEESTASTENDLAAVRQEIQRRRAALRLQNETQAALVHR